MSNPAYKNSIYGKEMSERGRGYREHATPKGGAAVRHDGVTAALIRPIALPAP